MVVVGDYHRHVLSDDNTRFVACVTTTAEGADFDREVCSRCDDGGYSDSRGVTIEDNEAHAFVAKTHEAAAADGRSAEQRNHCGRETTARERWRYWEHHNLPAVSRSACGTPNDLG